MWQNLGSLLSKTLSNHSLGTAIETSLSLEEALETACQIFPKARGNLTAVALKNGILYFKNRRHFDLAEFSMRKAEVLSALKARGFVLRDIKFSFDSNRDEL
ncbi:MAG: hypothetical protein V1821_02265 [bacterium]